MMTCYRKRTIKIQAIASLHLQQLIKCDKILRYLFSHQTNLFTIFPSKLLTIHLRKICALIFIDTTFDNLVRNFIKMENTMFFLLSMDAGNGFSIDFWSILICQTKE